MTQPRLRIRPRLHRLGLAALAAILLSTRLSVAADTPVTPDASPEAQALLNFFGDIYGKKVIAGQHDGWQMTNGLSLELNYLTNTTGKLPALLEMDLSPRPDPENRVLRRARDWVQNRHGLVAACWHWRAPLQAPAFYTKETTFDIARAVRPGTPEYAAVQADLYRVAAGLEWLRDAHIPVLWRPLHEANGRWFWWGAGGPEPFKQLWRMMFENFTRKHHLNNLIWVFSPGAETDLAAWYPGDAWVDIVAADNYPMDGNHLPAKEIFNELTRMTRGQKLIALGENGPIPDPALMQRDRALWLFFSTWSGGILFDQTTPAQVRAYYNHPRVLTLADLPDLKSHPAPPPGKPARLAFLGHPGDVAVGGHWYLPVSVAVRDSHGKTIREGAYPVTLALAGNHGGQLSGTTTVTTVNGVATFTDITLSPAAKHCRLAASATGLQPATSATFAVGPGNGLTGERWSHATDFSTPPEATEVLATALETPVLLATNYSARLRGWLIAPASGDYHFSVANPGRSELWLGTNAAAAQKIAAVTLDTPYRKWPHSNETDSPAVPLLAGHRYYFELRQWQDAGSTQLRVRWQLPDGTEERPIPAFRFQQF